MIHKTRALVCMNISLLFATPVFAEPLITPTEAALPAPAEAGMTMRGLTRGPLIELEQPSESKTVKSPTPFKVRFTGRNNATIDKDSIKITYVKTPMVDLTDRIRPHLKDTGIEMQNAEMPPGAHLIRIDVKDSQGRASTSLFKMIVE